jgi:hypothetical protein
MLAEAGVRRKSFSNSSRGFPFLGLSGTRRMICSWAAVKSGRFLGSSSCCIIFTFLAAKAGFMLATEILCTRHATAPSIPPFSATVVA